MPQELKSLTPQEVVAAYGKYKAGERSRGSMATSNWPTVLAHDCAAYGVFNRIVPGDKRRLIGESLAMIFSEGNDQARMVKRDLIDAGFEVSGEEEQMTWPQFQISGRRDLLIWKKGTKEKRRVEVKSTSPWTFDSINTADDLIHTSKMWLRKWWKQVALYMVLQSVEEYWLLLKNKQNGAIKIIEFKMTSQMYEAVEEMLKRAETINKLVQIKAMPPKEMKIEDADICSECEFFDTCLPDIAFGPGALILTDQMATELAAQLDRRASLAAARKEYEDIDEEVKANIKQVAQTGVDKIVAGDWICTVKESQRKGFEVKPQTIVKVNFIHVEK